MPSLPWWPVVVAVLSLFVALLVRGWAPGVASVLVVAASAFLAWELLGVVVMPLALGVVAVPTLVLGARWAAHAPGGGRRAAIAVATVIVIALEAVALATATRYTWRGTWAVSTWGPAILAAAVAGLAWAVSVRRAMATGASTTAAMVESTMAGRAALWSADERRREERAHWIHDAVLPRLSTGIRDIESGEPAAGSEALHHLAQDLREGLEDDQLTVLRVGGLSAALDDALEPARDAGFECQLSVDAEGDVPPWPVLVAAWRVAQEAIGNARRHSGGDRISVAVQMRHDHLMMEVSDDGVGLTDADLARRRGHLGMRSMTDAARAVQASLRFVAGSPSGLTVRFEWGR